MNRDQALALSFWLFGVLLGAFFAGFFEPHYPHYKTTAALVAFGCFSLIMWLLATWSVLDFFGTDKNRVIDHE